MRRYLVAAAVIMLVSVSAAPGKEPSHPLSQINPIDIDLNMSEQDIFNVSVFSLRDGLRFEGNQIQDSGGNPVLVWNDSSSQWELRNGDLNVQYNNISAPPGKNVSFQQNIRINGGGKIWVPESTNTPHYFYRKNLSEVLEDGESADRFDINLSGNNLESPDQIITDGSGSDVIEVRDRSGDLDIARFKEGGNVEIPNGELNLTGSTSSLLNPENILMQDRGGDGDKWKLIEGGDNDFYLQDQEKTRLRVFDTGDVEIPNGNLDMSNNNITNIDYLKFEEGTSLDGNISVNGSLDTSGDIDLENNDLIEPDEIRTGGSGSDVVAVRDANNKNDIARFKEGGNVEIPNGDLVMGDTAVRNANYFSGRANARQRVNMKTNGDIALQTDNGGSASTGLRVKDGNQNVEVPNGNLDISSGRIKIANDNWFMSETSGGTNAGLLKTTTGDHTLLHSNAGQNVQIEEGNDRMMTLYGSTNNVEIPNGNLDVSGSGRFNSLVGDSSGSQCGTNEFLNGNGNCQVDTDTDQDNQTLSDVLVQGNKTGDTDIDLDGGELVDSSGSVTLGGGDVEVTDGSIDMTDSSGDVFGTHGRLKVNSNPFVIASSSSNADVHIRADSGEDIAEFKDDTQNVVIPNGKLDLSGNNLTGFFDSACGENEAVTDVYNNGTFNCGQAGGGLPSVLDINNSANQDIDLYGNNITDSTGGNITFNQSLKVYGDLWLEGSASGGGGGSQNLSEVLENGNSTLGRGIDMDGGNITDIGGLQDCGQDEFVNGNGSCEVDTNTDTDNQNLQDVLVQGNATGGRDIDLDGGNLTDSTAGNVTIGKSLKVYGNIWAPEGAGLGGSQNLSEVLSNGNSTGGTDIDLDGANITDSTKGNVSVDDDLFVYGDIYGTGADLAEIYSSPQELEKGDVVAINTRKEDSVVRSSERYQETIAGVVSTNPGHTLNWNEDGYPIALAGKVPVKVTEENGEIEIGDRLVPSSTSGAAMKCETWDPLERKNKSLRRIVSHNQDCRNSAIGKALESSTGRGKILVKLE